MAVNFTKEELVQAILELSKDDFVSVMGTIAKMNQYPEETTYITNTFQRARKAEKNANSTGKPKLRYAPGPTKMFVKPDQPKLKEGREGKCSRAFESSPSASLLPDIHGMSAWKTPFLFRGDLIPKNGKVFIDVEKLSMKLPWGNTTPFSKKTKHRQVGNNVVVVDEKGILLFWAFIYRDTTQICQYITSLHRITKAKVLQGVPLEVVRPVLERCLSSNTVVGAKVQDDLKSLSYPEELLKNAPFTHDKQEELQNFYVDAGGQPFKLKDLASHFFPDQAESFQKDTHSAVVDARMTMKLYLKMCELKKNSIDASLLNIRRSSGSAFKFDKTDICRCTK